MDVTGETERIISDSGKPSGCARAYVIGIVGILVLFGLCSLPRVIGWLYVSGNRISWSNRNIRDYTLTVRYSNGWDNEEANTSLVVRNGRVSSANGDYPQLTIDGLFDRALACAFWCSVEFDATYAYPKLISGGFPFSGGRFEVIIFSELNS